LVSYHNPLFNQSHFDSWNSEPSVEEIEDEFEINTDQVDWKRIRTDERYQFAMLSRFPELCIHFSLLGKNYRTVIHQNFEFIGKIRNPTLEMYRYAIASTPAAWTEIHVRLPDDLYIKTLKIDSNYFKYFNNPSHAVCKYAVTLDPKNIKYVSKQTYELQLRCIRKSPIAIRHCINPTKKIKWMAIHGNPNTIQYIKNRSQTMVLTAIQLDLYRNPNSTLVNRVPDKFTQAKMYVKLLNA